MGGFRREGEIMQLYCNLKKLKLIYFLFKSQMAHNYEVISELESAF